MRLELCLLCEGPLIGKGLQRLCSDCNKEWRWCANCESIHKMDEFYTPGKTLLRYCYKSKLEAERIRRQTPEGKLTEYINHLVCKFKIPREQAIDLANQKACAICNKTPNERLHIDHNHLTKRVRGALCRRCNYAVSVLEDDLDWQESLAHYLEHHAGLDKVQFT